MRILSWYAKQSHDRPWVVLGIHFLWMIAAASVVMMTGQVALTTTDGEEWLLSDEEMVERYDALDAARLQLPGALAEDSAELPRTEIHLEATTIFMYVDEENGNMLTPRGLLVIKQVEETYIKNEQYADFCMLTYNGTTSMGCVLPKSLLAPGVLLPESKSDGKQPGYTDLSGVTQEQIDARLREILDDPIEMLALSFFFDADFGKNCADLESPPPGCSGVNLASRMTRSKLEAAAFPLDAFVDKEGEEDEIEAEMEDEVESFLKEVDEDLISLLGMKGSMINTPLVTKGTLDGVHVLWHNAYLQQRDFSATVNSDLMWAAASLIAVASYIAVHTRSLMLAALGMVQVIFSFVLAIFVTKLVFQVDYMDMMVVLIIFVTLGIGADDVFVFVDCFKQSEAVPAVCGSLLARIEYTLERASKAIFITSLTTMVAFLMTSISDLINIQAFGIFAGMNIFFLFLQTVLLMPAAVVIWERSFSWLPCCVCLPACLCCNNRDRVLNERERRAVAMTERSEREFDVDAEMMAPKQAGKMDGDLESSNPSVPIPAIRASDSKRAMGGGSNFAHRTDRDGLGSVERFFHGPYMTFLARGKYVIAIAFIAVAAVGGYFAGQLAPPADTEAFMPGRHMFTKFNNLVSPNAAYWAGSSEETTSEVKLVWGIKGMDTSERKYWDPTDRGEIMWDTTWDPTSEAAQKFLLTVCPIILQGRCRDGTIGCGASRMPGEEGVRWLVRRSVDHPKGEAECWVEDMRDELRERGLEMPLKPAVFATELRAYYNTHPDVRDLIGYVEGPDDGGELELRFLAIAFTSTFREPRSAGITTAVMDDWEDAAKALVAEAPQGMRGGFMVGGYAFVWSFTQKSLVYNAVTGLGYVFAIAFVVINLATLNLLVSTITTATIAGIVVTVLGVGAKGISGWEFGTAESLATVILIGFSMDYCLHIAGAYIESEAEDRVERTRDALTHLGVSVVAGAITTILSGLFLWGTVMIFFQKFAFLITFTVVVSFLWSVTFLPAILLIMGPEGDSFGWLTMLRLCGLRKNKITPEGSP